MVKRQTDISGFLTPSANKQNKRNGKQGSKKVRSTKNQKKAVRRSERQAKRQARINPDDSDVVQPRKKTTGINHINDSGEFTQTQSRDRDAVDIAAVADHTA